MADTTSEFCGGGWGDNPTNDPGELQGTKPNLDQGQVPANTKPDNGKVYDNAASSKAPAVGGDSFYAEKYTGAAIKTGDASMADSYYGEAV